MPASASFSPAAVASPWEILDHVTEAVSIIGPDGALLYANPSAATLLKRLAAHVDSRPTGVIGRGARRRDGTAVASRDLPVEVTRRTGRPVSVEEIGVPGVHGDTRWLRISTQPVDPDVLPCTVVATCTDITDQQRAQAPLTLCRFRAVFDHSPTGMVIVDLEGVVQQVNPAFATLVGYHEEDLIGAPKTTFTHPQDRASDIDALPRLIAGEIPRYRSEKRYLHAHGHSLWVQVDATLIRDADGRPEFVLGQTQDISERRHHARKLEHLADHDALTGLLNRRGFACELERHVARTRRYHSGGALLMLDLDHFKYVNDALGHKAGDELIVAVADLLRTRMRASDVVARLGGDEFAILLPEGDLSNAEQAAASLLQALADRPPVPGAAALRLSASIGIAALTEETTAEELLVCADLAMYDAKQDGRGGWARYAADGPDEPRTRARMTWVDRIRAALDGDGFRLLAQPIVDARTGAVSSYELLLRMMGEDGDLIPPAAFLYIAERFDLIQELDRWVLGQACDLLGAARTARHELQLSANVSGRSLSDPTVLDGLEEGLARSGANPADLVIEITETSAVTQIHHARAFAERVKQLGARLAIDDFGAGLGSYLKHLPFDLLKIDGEFVQGAPTSRPDALIVKAVRDLAHGLGRTVVAECCSDANIHDWLIAHDVDLLQGYHLGRPRPVEEVLAGPPR